MDKLLLICGPTATGKTLLGLDLARRFNGEIISADSRQVYTGLDIVTGKDLPPSARPSVSAIKWRDRFLKYYLVKDQKVWLYDIVTPVEPFNVSFWSECANLVIGDILSRHKLPIIVGGSGLYLKSIVSNLASISVPTNQGLRRKLSTRSVASLFNYLKRIDPLHAAQLNQSDSGNPRRLIRAIEISLSPPSISSHPQYDSLSLGLSAPLPVLKSRIDHRITDRLRVGALAEAKKISSLYDPRLPAFSACGYPALLTPDPIVAWTSAEHAYLRHQLTWFKKQSHIHWLDITSSDWQSQAVSRVSKWYN